MVGRTDARAEESNLSTATRAAGLYTQAGREAEAVRNTDNPRSGCANGGGAGPRTYLRGRSAGGTVRLSSRPQRTGRRTTRTSFRYTLSYSAWKRKLGDSFALACNAVCNF